MTLFFKQKTTSYCQLSRAYTTKQILNEGIIAFVKDEFPGLIEGILSEEAAAEFIDLILVLIMSHRSEKEDPSLRDTIIDFPIVRDPMYKYSIAAQERFLNYPAYSFLFQWFYECPTGKVFAQSKVNEGGVGACALFNLDALAKVS